MKKRSEFRKSAIEAAGVLVKSGLGDVVLCFDYRLEPGEPVDAPGLSKAVFFPLTAKQIVDSIENGTINESGELVKWDY